MPDTDSTEFGLWPTPYGMTPDGLSHGPSGNELGRAVNQSLLPTPSSRDWKDTPGMARTGTNPDGSNRKRTDQLARRVYDDLWPTPQAKDGDAGADYAKLDRSKTGISLQTAAAMWPTPQARDGDNRGAIPERYTNPDRSSDLPDAVAMYPTPDLGAAKGRGQASASQRNRLGGSLNPTWVEWLMGYPEGWTDLEV